MTLIALLVLLLVVGIILPFLPLDATVRNLIFAVLAVLVLLWLLSFFGLIPGYR